MLALSLSEPTIARRASERDRQMVLSPVEWAVITPSLPLAARPWALARWSRLFFRMLEGENG